jgi:hypothetical protein
MHLDKLSKPQREALQALEDAENVLIKMGFCILRQAAWYANEHSAHFNTRCSIGYSDEHPMFDHVYADAIRDISVEWSNARHSNSILCWRKRRYTK